MTEQTKATAEKVEEAAAAVAAPAAVAGSSAAVSSAAAASSAPRSVVIDAGAAIKLQRLERFGGTLYSTSGVLREIKDEKARALLDTLPEEIRVKEPLPADIAFVKQFAKLTGDYGFLSQNDVDIIALTVTLHKESGGVVREKPTALSCDQGKSAFDWAPPAREKACTAPVCKKGHKLKTHVAEDDGWACDKCEKDCPTGATLYGCRACDYDLCSACATDGKDAKAENVEVENGEEAEAGQEDTEDNVNEEDEDSEDGDSAGEWVTVENVHRFGVKAAEVAQDVELKVTCATSDYSVQNVLLQMGITPLTFDGYAVRSVKIWGLICRACFHFSRDTEKVFCAKCGNDTVVRVPIMVDQDGKPTVLSNGRPLRKKGTIFSIPKVQGGRGWKPIFAQDEILLGGRDRELRRQQNLANKERLAKDPFDEDNGARAWYQRSGTSNKSGTGPSSGSVRMQAGYGRRINPNANNFKGFRKK